MPSVYDIKPAFQRLLRPLTASLARHGVTANQVTLAALVLSIAAGAAIVLIPGRTGLLILPAALFVRMVLNAIDGMLAREHGQKSNLGAILNEVADVLSDSAMYGALAFGWLEPMLVVPVIALAAASELTGVMGQVLGGARQYQGPMGKSDRALIFGILAGVLAVGVGAGLWTGIALGLINVLLVVTIVNRARAALRGAKA